MSQYFDVEVIAIADIAIKATWQVRKATNKVAIKRYAATYSAGGDMEPVQVARVNGALILVDGIHRIIALQSLGRDHVDARVTAMKEHAAQWAAASANLAHGLPLKNSELRQVFRQYIATGQHRQGRGRVKSLRDILKDIPGVRSHSTISKWLLADYPDLYARSYAGSGAEGHVHGGFAEYVQPNQQALDMQTITDALRQVEAIAATLPMKLRRGVAVKVEATRERLLG